jgi:predicted metal-dependent phosphotriesterase family hydrolase
MKPKLLVQRGDENTEWPREVGEAFLRFHRVADAHGFNVICAVGFNFEHSENGQAALSTILSPRASRNPHLGEMLKDIAELFEASCKRQQQ